MEKFDRKLQREILQACVDSYPSTPLPERFNNTLVAECAQDDIQKLIANIYYLFEHDLIYINNKSMMHDILIIGEISASAKGVDFMLNDGGLGAILNVQTIKFHRDAVVVLEDLITISNMDDEQKDQAKSSLGELSIKTLESVVQAGTTAVLSKLLGQ
ncbi:MULTISPECIES: hypothetical protein [Klebsiella/Raoultella group]|uniref:hypothetical protein n=1 Tax=Klebsiella/Raoultella group TaxID=2890311 RepID=UPI0002CD03FF|nr:MULTISPECIES: hypothetical protein [Klebsiella/Raoultella group]AGJ86700.1 hypothetical protein RORB6_10070 [Raoultella ornithinolytica B6]DAO00418.1 MAG TPA: hypothetical protein [Caudoviricetes sp.]